MLRSVNMDELPDEVLLMIFEALSPRDLLRAPGRVCKRWRHLLRRRVLRVSSRLDLNLVTTSLGIRALEVVTCVPMSPLLTAAMTLKKLAHLTVHAGAPFTDSNMKALSVLPCLRHLDIFLHMKVIDARYNSVLTQLNSLVINELVSRKVLPVLNNLQALHMYGRSSLYPATDLKRFLHARAAHLTELTLRCPELGEQAFKAIGTCHNLIELKLYSCWTLSSNAAVYLSSLPLLRVFHATSTCMLRHRALTEFLSTLTQNIEELNLSSSCFDDSHAVILAERFLSLRVLELWWCKLSSEGVTRLATKLPLLLMLDINLQLSQHQLLTLEKHPTLKRIRCLPMNDLRNANEADELKKLQVISSEARYAQRYFRGTGQGFRADLFYFSIPEEDLKLLPKESQTGFYDEEDYTFY